MIPQAGMFSAIPFTQSNSKTMMVALLAGPPEESGPCPDYRLSLWGGLMTGVGRGETEGTKCSVEKGPQNDNNACVCIHFPLSNFTAIMPVEVGRIITCLLFSDEKTDFQGC